jgi:hypothetical protein
MCLSILVRVCDGLACRALTHPSIATVFKSYAVVTMDEATLFVNESCLSDADRNLLHQSGVMTSEYGEFMRYVGESAQSLQGSSYFSFRARESLTFSHTHTSPRQGVGEHTGQSGDCGQV